MRIGGSAPIVARTHDPQGTPREAARGAQARKKPGARRARSDYAWMAGLLPRPRRRGCVLEVGADRNGTAALVERGLDAWCRWRRRPCWRRASSRRRAGRRRHVLAARGAPRGASRRWSRSCAPWACARPRRHRLAVQTLVYRLADRVLRPGGVLQMVDRMIEPFGEVAGHGDDARCSARRRRGRRWSSRRSTRGRIRGERWYRCGRARREPERRPTSSSSGRRRTP